MVDPEIRNTRKAIAINVKLPIVPGTGFERNYGAFGRKFGEPEAFISVKCVNVAYETRLINLTITVEYFTTQIIPTTHILESDMGIFDWTRTMIFWTNFISHIVFPAGFVVGATNINYTDAEAPNKCETPRPNSNTPSRAIIAAANGMIGTPDT